MKGNSLGLSSTHIEGEKNTIADSLSRLPHINFELHYNTLLQTQKPLDTYRHFHPSQELILLIWEALLEGKLQALNPLNNMGHFEPGRNSG